MHHGQCYRKSNAGSNARLRLRVETMLSLSYPRSRYLLFQSGHYLSLLLLPPAALPTIHTITAPTVSVRCPYWCPRCWRFKAISRPQPHSKATSCYMVINTLVQHGSRGVSTQPQRQQRLPNQVTDFQLQISSTISLTPRLQVAAEPPRKPEAFEV